MIASRLSITKSARSIETDPFDLRDQSKLTPLIYLTTAVSILLVSVDNSQMNISISLKTQRNNRITP